MSAQSEQLRQGLADNTLDKLADEMALGPTSQRYHAATAELCRRQAEWQKEATKAQKNSARYMLLSVIAIAITSGLTALFSYLGWAHPHIK